MKKDLSSIVSTGTPTQRALLLAEVIAHANWSRTGEQLLSETELKKLSDSFRSPREIQLWNKFSRLDKLVTAGINIYQGGHYEALYRVAQLRGWGLYWDALEEAELVFNCLLLEALPGEDKLKARKKAASKVLKKANFIYGEYDVEEDGTIGLKVDLLSVATLSQDKSKTTLLKIMDRRKKDLEKIVIRQISWEKALLDVMAEEGFRVKTYKQIIREISQDLKKQLNYWGRYVYEMKERLGPYSPRAVTLLREYDYSVNIEGLEVSQEDYNYFRENHLSPGRLL